MSLYTDLIDETARVFSVHPRDLLSRAKFDFLLPPRFALYYALHQRGNTLSQIGRWTGRDHTTVRHGVIRARSMMEEKPGYRAKVEALTQYQWHKEQTT